MRPDRLNDQLLTISDAPLRCGACEAEILGTGLGPYHAMRFAVGEHWRDCPGSPEEGKPARARAAFLPADQEANPKTVDPPADAMAALIARIQRGISLRAIRRAQYPPTSKLYAEKTGEIGSLRIVLTWLLPGSPGGGR